MNRNLWYALCGFRHIQECIEWLRQNSSDGVCELPPSVMLRDQEALGELLTLARKGS